MGLLGSNVLGPFQIGYKFAIKKKYKIWQHNVRYTS